MAEENEAPDSGAEAGASGADPAAAALALNAASGDPSIAQDARAYLREQRALAADQRRLVQLQAKELSHELGLRHRSLWVRHASGLLKLALELCAGLLLLAVVGGISIMVWNAAHADGLVIESFSVPPDMAERGLTGQVVASQVLDRVTEMNATRSNRAAQSYTNNWGDDLKVEIPETGVSVGEAYRFLKAWLGHETHVSGEMWRTDSGIAITARVAGGGATVTGSSADLPALVQKTAEDIYNRTQPYRYAVYLDRHGRVAEALSHFKSLALTGAASDRGWAYLGWAIAIEDSAPIRESEQLLLKAEPYHAPPAVSNLYAVERALGRYEAALAYLKETNALVRDGGGGVNPDSASALVENGDARLFEMLGDYHDAVVSYRAMGDSNVLIGSVSYQIARAQIGEHDLGGARDSVANPMASGGVSFVSDLLARPEFDMEMAWERQDWAGFVSRAAAMAPILAKYPGRASGAATGLQPQLAYAQARLGHIAAAEAMIAPTPGDCYPCLRIRARIAELRGQHARADFWFARAAAIAPSFPFAHTEWGQALLERGQPDAAIEKFKLANQKGPHFADPLEMWGEALMAKNQSHLAVLKFAEAEKYAPNWGRLHLKWGEALGYAGKLEEAKAQFARAAALDLTAADEAVLARVSAHG